MIRPDTWLVDRWNGLRRGTRIAVVAIFALALSGVSVLGYRQYNYIQHDNEFCLSCHLMTDAYERFQRSAHNEISCHTCHPAGVSTVWQLYATLFLDPTEVKRHPHVANATCEQCHSRAGGSERWQQVRRTGGHRIHLESQDSVLRDVQCVRCHSVGVHEFNPTSATCRSAGCHPDAAIRLGKMGDLDIYCTTCHSFLADAPTITFDSLGGAISPRAAQCLSCHRMRQALGTMEFLHDPHKGQCGFCHNAHTQTSGSQAATGCLNGACHTTWLESPFHTGVPNPQQCTRCHVPHSWKVEGANCIRCHAEIMRPTAPTRPHQSSDRAPARHRDLAAR